MGPGGASLHQVDSGMGWRIGVDIGGTFTDVATVDTSTGKIDVVKTLTTPKDIAKGVTEALALAIERQAVPTDEVTLLSHATTVVTNALLEEKGARTALVATRGFRDLLELRRSSRARLYDLFQDGPSLLVPRHRRYEITERIGADGEVVTLLAEGELDGIIAAIRLEKVEAVAVTLLFSFLNDDHERLIGARLRAALPGVPVFLSSEVLPEVREFERTSTTAVCAYVGPILASYLERLETAVSELGLPALNVMGSSGGVVDVAEVLKMPAMAVESGPAAGVIAAAFIGRQLDLPDLISFDMGGTTAKASLIKDGEIEVTSEYEVGRDGNVSRWMTGTGHPIRVPVIDLAEVSAGGGSIAWIDTGGALRVGPRSAGAEPGPVCYGRGGADPTVTDCDLVLGYLDPARFGSGGLNIDADGARQAIDRKLAQPMGLSIEAAAAGVITVVNNAMAEALRIVSVERGHDPREFTMVAFGGAGPVHAASLAEALDIPQVIVPPIPGGFSALGLVATDLRRDYGRTFFARLDQTPPEAMADAFANMERVGVAFLDQVGIPEANRELQRSADLRYVRQAYEIPVPMAQGPINGSSLAALAAAFHVRHRQTYGHDSTEEPVQIVNLRLSALGRLEGLELRSSASPATDVASDLAAARRPSRTVYFDGASEGAVYDRDLLPAGAELAGPAIVEAADATIVIPPGWSCLVDARGLLMLTRLDEGGRQ